MLTIVLAVMQERVLPHCAGSTLSNFCEVKALSISDNKSHLHTSSGNNLITLLDRKDIGMLLVLLANVYTK